MADTRAIQAELDAGYQLARLRQQNSLRHARAWVGTLVDYVLLALPAVAPIPNLLNLRIALAPVLGIGASTIAAIAFELLLFGSAEIILYLQDKQMRSGGYVWPLRIGVACGVAFLAVLWALIFAYEVPQHGYAVLTLPLVSVISIAFLSLKRWADMREAIAAENAVATPMATNGNSTEIATEISNGNSAETRRKLQLQLRANGVATNKGIAETLREKAPTISKDRKWLQSKNYLDGNGKITDAGLQFLDGGNMEIAAELPQAVGVSANGKHA